MINWGTGWWVDRSTSPLISTDPKVENTFVGGLTFPTTGAGAKQLDAKVRCWGADVSCRVSSPKAAVPLQLQSSATATLMLEPPFKAAPITVRVKARGTLVPDTWQGSTPAYVWEKSTLPATDYPQSEVGVSASYAGSHLNIIGNKALFDVVYFTGTTTNSGGGHSTVSKQFPVAAPWDYGTTGTAYPSITWRYSPEGAAPYETTPNQTAHCLSPGGHYFAVGNKAATSNVIWFRPPAGPWAATTLTTGVADTPVRCFATDASNFWLFDRINVQQGGQTNYTWRWRKWNGSTWSAATNLVLYGTKGYEASDLMFVHGPAGSNVVFMIHTLTDYFTSGNTWTAIRTFNTSTGALGTMTGEWTGQITDITTPRWVPPYYTYHTVGTDGYISVLGGPNSGYFVQFKFALATPSTITVFDSDPISSYVSYGLRLNSLWSIETDPVTEQTYFCIWQFSVSVGAVQIRVSYRPLIGGSWSGPFLLTGTPTATYTNGVRALAVISPQAGATAPTTLMWEMINGTGLTATRYEYEAGIRLWATTTTMLDGQADNVVSITASLTAATSMALSATAAAVVTVEGDIYVRAKLAASVAAVSTVTGTLTDYIPLEPFYLNQQYIQVGTTYLEDFVAIMNAVRVSLGLPIYKLAGIDVLSASKINIYDQGQAHAKNLAVIGYVGHESPLLPEGEQTFHDRLYKTTTTGGENITAVAYADEWQDPSIIWGFATPQAIYDLWYNSLSHRENMERDWGSYNDTMYTAIGVDVGFYEPYGGVYPDGYFDPIVGDAPPFRYVYTYFTNVFLSLTEVYVEVNLSQHWANTGAVISILDQAWSNASYTHVKTEHEGLYSVLVAAAHEADYSASVQAEHDAPTYYSLQVDHEGPYTQAESIGTIGHEAPYAIRKEVVQQSHEAPCALNLVNSHTAEYTQNSSVTKSHQADYSQYSQSSAEHSALYGVASTVAGSHTTLYGQTTGVVQRHEAPIVYPTALQTSHEARWDLDQYNQVLTPHSAFYTLLDTAGAAGPNEVFLYHGSSTLRLRDGYVSLGKNDVGYRFQTTVDDVGVFATMSEGDTILVDFCGEQYLFVIATKSVERSEVGKTRCTIAAASPVMFMDLPYVPSFDYVPQADMTAQAMVEELLDDTVTWEVATWTIPKGRVQISQSSPLSAVKTILNAVKASAVSEPDGTVAVRYTYPYNWDKLWEQAADQVYSDVQHNLSASQNFEYREGFNKFRVRDGDSSFGDRIQWTADKSDLYTGIARVYPSPYRSSWQLRTTRTEGVLVDSLGELVEQFTEVVEFRAGRGSVANPILTLDSIVWKSASLEAVSFVPYGSEITTGITVNEGYGVASVTYSAKAYQFKVTANTTVDVAQLIVQEN